MKASEYTFPLAYVMVGDKRIMIEGLPPQITWLDIQDVAGKVVHAVRRHRDDQGVKLGEIRIRPNGIVFSGKGWKAVYGKAT